MIFISSSVFQCRELRLNSIWCPSSVSQRSGCCCCCWYLSFWWSLYGGDVASSRRSSMTRRLSLRWRQRRQQSPVEARGKTTLLHGEVRAYRNRKWPMMSTTRSCRSLAVLCRPEVADRRKHQQPLATLRDLSCHRGPTVWCIGLPEVNLCRNHQRPVAMVRHPSCYQGPMLWCEDSVQNGLRYWDRLSATSTSRLRSKSSHVRMLQLHTTSRQQWSRPGDEQRPSRSHYKWACLASSKQVLPAGMWTSWTNVAQFHLDGFYLLSTKEEVYVFARVRLSVCLSLCLCKITQKGVHGFGWNVACRQMSGHGRTD